MITMTSKRCFAGITCTAIKKLNCEGTRPAQTPIQLLPKPFGKARPQMVLRPFYSAPGLTTSFTQFLGGGRYKEGGVEHGKISWQI